MVVSWQDRHKVVPSVFVVLERGSKVLLLRRANTGYRDGYFSLPAGHLDGGETAQEAACREALEEVGIELKPGQLEFVHVAHRRAEEGDHERVDFYFRAKAWQGEPANKEPHKCDELHWASYDNLPETMVPSVREVLFLVRNGQYYSEVPMS